MGRHISGYYQVFQKILFFWYELGIAESIASASERLKRVCEYKPLLHHHHLRWQLGATRYTVSGCMLNMFHTDIHSWKFTDQ